MLAIGGGNRARKSFTRFAGHAQNCKRKAKLIIPRGKKD